MSLEGFLVRREALTVVVSCFAVALAALAPGIYGGDIISHSSWYNATWAEGFAQQLAAGHLYPRYLPDVSLGLGSPVFYFYGPLPFYLAAPFVWLTGSASLGVVLASTVMLALSGMAVYLLLRELTGREPALVLAVVAMLMPYHYLMDIWIRGAFGEQMAFVFLPLGLWAVLGLWRDERRAAALALATAGMTLSHLPSAMIFDVTVAAFALAVAWRHRAPRLLVLAAVAGAAGTLTAAVYLLPAFAGRDFIRSDMWSIFRPEDYYVGQMRNAFDFMMVAGLIPSTAVVILAGRRLWRAGPGEARLWIITAAIVLLLVSPLAIPVWKVAGPFRYIQFPWRSLVVFELAIVAITALAWRHSRDDGVKFLRMLLIGVGFLAVFCAVLRYGPDPDQNRPLRAAANRAADMMATRADALEYMPPCLDFSLADYQGRLSTLDAARSIVAKGAPAGALLKFYYPFLRVLVNGQPAAISCRAGAGLVALDQPLPSGAVVTIEATPLPVERLAGLLSLAGLAGIAGLYLWARRRRQA